MPLIKIASHPEKRINISFSNDGCEWVPVARIDPDDEFFVANIPDGVAIKLTCEPAPQWWHGLCGRGVIGHG